MSEKKTVGYGYVGRWSDGELGWAMPGFVDTGKDNAARRRGTRGSACKGSYARNAKLELCRITIEPVKDSRGRPILYYPREKP